VRIRSERGFSMVELLTVVAIIGILAKMSLSAFAVYRGKAEFSKAASLYTNARTAATAGEEDLGSGYSMAFTESTNSGSPLAGSLAAFFPNISMTKDVILGASVSPCGGATMDPNLIISVKPCRGDGKHIEYIRFCDGTDTTDFSSAGNGC
jgi:prepilin-type N-terminal cleavage/methylation domain-containing protein